MSSGKSSVRAAVADICSHACTNINLCHVDNILVRFIDTAEVGRDRDISVLAASMPDLSSLPIICDYPIQISKMVQLGAINLTTITTLPINSIFFGTENGYYVAEALYMKMLSCALIPVVNRGNDVDLEAERRQNAELQETIAASKDRVVVLRQKVDQEAGILALSKRESEKATKQKQLEKVSLSQPIV
jgi:hypothetical protein